MAVILRLLVVTVVFSLPFSALAREEGSDLIQTTDLFKIRHLSNVVLSPDGETAAYVVREIVEKKDKKKDTAKGADRENGDGKRSQPERTYRAQIWLAALDGETPPRQLTHGDTSARQPRWSPDAGRLAFVRAVDGTPQIFLLPLGAGGEAWQVTREENGAAAPRFSPDGSRLAYLTELAHHEVRAAEASAPLEFDRERAGRTAHDTANWADEGNGGEEKPSADPDGDLGAIREFLARNASDEDPRVFTRPDFHGETDLDPELGYSHLKVVDLQPDAEAVDLTPGYVSFGPPAWSSDGARLFAASRRDRSLHPDRALDSEIFTVATDGSGAELFLDLPGYTVFGPTPSPDGSTVAFFADPLDDLAYGQLAVGVVPAAGGDAKLLTLELDRSARALVWSPDSRLLYLTAASDGGFPIYRVAATGGAVERLTPTTEGVRAFDAGPNGLAYVLTRPSNPYELYAASLDAESPRRLSEHNAGWLAGKRLSVPEAHELTRPDGTKVSYWTMKPTVFEAGKRYPLLLEIHGGPASMWGPGEDTMWHEFQLYAARGFGLVFGNPRGSGGYGREFQAANYRDWGTGPEGDVLAAASVVAEEPWVDPERQVVTGGSYAGYLTAWIVSQDHRFKAAVAQRGVYELSTFFGEGNAWRLVPWHFGGYPWEAEAYESLRANSPLTFVEDIRTPLLILHGDQDLRTGVIQSEMLYKSLKILDRPVEYVRYPNAAHDLSRTGDPNQRVDRLLRIYEFLARFL